MKRRGFLALAAMLGGQARAQPQSQQAQKPPTTAAGQPGQPQGCTRETPCIGPRGGRYYFTPSGAKRYLPR